jgi:hypothetical protein
MAMAAGLGCRCGILGPVASRHGNFPKISNRFALRALREFLHFVRKVHADFSSTLQGERSETENAALLYDWL